MESKLMTTNEPTTGEIVRALREDCSLLDDNTDKFAAADRLESQEREIEELKAEAIVNALENAERIANLTARAEQAEARENAAIADLTLAAGRRRGMKRRDITLGEMQDECKKHNGGKFATNDICLARECTMYNVCTFGTGGMTPANIDLTDPPRFTEAQMALLRGLYDNGIWRLKADAIITSMYKFNYEYVGNFINRFMGIEIDDGETLDLAELLGKDGAE